MSKPPHLTRRGNRYYIRRRVPLDLVDALGGKREITYSLGTDSYREAVERLRIEELKIDTQFANSGMRSKGSVPKLTKAAIERMALVWFHDIDTRSAKAEFSLLGQSAWNDYLHDANSELQELGNGLDGEEPAIVQGTADEILIQNGWPSEENSEHPKIGDIQPASKPSPVPRIDKSGAEYRHLCEYVWKAKLEAAQRVMGRISEHRFSPDPFFSEVGVGKPDPREAATSSITLEELTEQYSRDPARSHLTEKTKLEYAVVYRALKELLGPGKRVRGIRRADCRRLRDILLTLPPNASKRFPKMTLEQASEHARRNDLSSIDPRTANGYLNKLSSLFRWGVREQFMSENPAEGLKVSTPLGRPKDGRDPFDAGQLNKIFRAPLYTGCQNDLGGYSRPGPNVIKRARFWVPLIALYSGMRLNEICQLLVADVLSRDGVLCFVVTTAAAGDDGVKRIKSRAGERIVPVHPDLAKMGFDAHVAGLREHGERRLFPELKADRRGYYSDHFQKWFSRFLDKVGAKRPKTSFHSFRHNFRDALREAEISRDVVLALGGWEGGGTEETYGAGLRASTLHREICKVRYPDVDLSHLYNV